MRHSRIAMVLAAAVVLAACGSAGGSSNSVTKTTVPVSRKIVLTSIMTTTAAKTARVDLEVTVTGDASKGALTATGDGVTDFATGDTDVTARFDGPIGTASGQDFEIRSVGGVLYMRPPSSSFLPLPDGKSWVVVHPSNNGISLRSPMDIGSQADPTKVLAYLESVSNDVHTVGSEKIRGVDTTHYAATLDLAKLIDASNVPPGLHDGMKALAGLFGTIPADVWIDSDGRLRRERIQLDLDQIFRAFDESGTSTGNPVVITETLDLYDFGTPVHVETPPANQVTQSPNAGEVPSLKMDANA